MSRAGVCRVMLVLALAAGCGDTGKKAAAPTAPTPPAALVLSDDAAARWARHCALCHVDGNAGAPRIGHAQEWQDRLAQGSEVLMQHTVEGLGMMPPLGYCMSCEREDFEQLIAFMSAAANGAAP